MAVDEEKVYLKRFKHTTWDLNGDREDNVDDVSSDETSSASG